MSNPIKASWRRALIVLTIILVAQLIIIPAADASACPFRHLVRRGETLSGLARRFGTTVNAIAAANGIVNPNRIFAGTFLLIPCPGVPCPGCPPSGCTIIVQRGDTLSAIAVRFHTTVFRLMQLNCICNPNLIFAGQRLRVC